VLESFMPGALAEAGLDYAALSAGHPELIMTSLTPFGQTGPWANRAWSDGVGLALGGPMAMCGYDHLPDMPPIRPTENHAFHIGSHFGAMGTIIALIERAAGTTGTGTTGAGQYIDASIHEACATTTEGGMPYALIEKTALLRQTGRHAAANPTEPWNYAAADGPEINIFGMPRGDADFLTLVEWADEIGMVGNLRDPELMDGRKRQLGISQDTVRMMLADLKAFIASKPAQEIYRGGQDRGAAWGIVNAPDELLNDPHFHERGFWVEVEHEELDRTITYPGAPAKLLGTPWEIQGRAPLLGEHTQAILRDELQLDAGELQALLGAGVIA
jgi:crotonobetainyl-CoA:carnitine CoA-transferase CaiB-like acyl-CoA transferase